MSLTVDPPNPPELAAVDPNEYEDATISGGTDVDYRREELQEFLADGAWEEAFEEWTADTDLTEEEFRIARELDLFAEFDFFWDSFADRVGYHAPGIPEDWQEREYHADLNTWGNVSSINAELTELGQLICDILKNDYVDWESEYEPPEDLPDF